jgi:hypothetical protein
MNTLPESRDRRDAETRTMSPTTAVSPPNWSPGAPLAGLSLAASVHVVPVRRKT